MPKLGGRQISPSCPTGSSTAGGMRFSASTNGVLEYTWRLPGYRARARRCIDFLLKAQLQSVAFPGMEIGLPTVGKLPC